MHDEIGLNFARRGAPSCRQDPTSSLVGEIRDFEDRRNRGQASPDRPHGAVHAAPKRRAGHHSRLLNMGVEGRF